MYCFDPRIFKDADLPKYHIYKTRKTGLIRAKFIKESVENLRENLKKIGSELVVSDEKPEIFLKKLLSPDSTNLIIY